LADKIDYPGINPGICNTDSQLLEENIWNFFILAPSKDAPCLYPLYPREQMELHQIKTLCTAKQITNGVKRQHIK
jgi:hypothetical protein